MPSSDPIFPIGSVSDRTGIPVSALRFYEEKGLITPIRTATGQRRYRRSDLRRLSFIRISQQLGFSLSEIGEQLEKLPSNKAPTRADWKRISSSFGCKLDERIALMQRLREKLEGCIGCGCLSLGNCHLHNPDDEAARLGSGPGFLFRDGDSA